MISLTLEFVVKAAIPEFAERDGVFDEPLTSNLAAGFVLPIPTLPLPLTKKREVPAEFCTSKVPTPPSGEATPSLIIAVGVAAVVEPCT